MKRATKSKKPMLTLNGVGFYSLYGCMVFGDTLRTLTKLSVRAFFIVSFSDPRTIKTKTSNILKTKTMKNLLSSKNLFAGHLPIRYALLVLLMTMTNTNLSAQNTTNPVCVDGIYYDRTKCAIVGYDPNHVGRIDIQPDVTIDGTKYHITQVCDSACAGCENIESVTLVLSQFTQGIGTGAFEGCTNLRNLNITSSLSSGFYHNMGDSAFKGCTSLETITLPYNMNIAYKAFEGCTKLSDVAFQEDNPENYKGIIGGIMNIYSYAFSGCTSLTSFWLPYGCGRIEDYAFDGCTALTQVTGFCYGMNFSAFNGCSALRTIDVNVSGYIHCGEFTGCDKLGNINLTLSYNPEKRLYPYESCELANIGKSWSVTFTDDVTEIGAGAFNGCSDLVNITLPNTLETIGDYAFCGTGISSISLTDNISYGKYAFAGCKNLTSIAIPEKWTSIPVGLFSGCGNLVTIEIPDGITEIGDYAFYKTILKDVTLPESLTTIGSYCFYNTHLTSIIIPQNVTSIGGKAFYQEKTNWFIDTDGAERRVVIGTVVSKAATPPTMETCYSLDGSGIKATLQFGEECYDHATLIVPDGSVDLYKQADEWKKFYKIISEKEATGITTASDNAESTSPKYNLNGMRIKQARTGEVYIKDGKKFIAK